MKVTLRKRLKNNKISLYLDYYEKGVRKYEYLHLYLVPKPKNKLERDTNKKYLELADMIRAKRQIEVVEKKYGFESSSESSTTFIAYFESLARKRMSVKNNYGVWRSTLNMLKKYPKSHTLIQNIDKRWLYDLQEFMKGLKKDDNQPYAMDSLYTYYGKVRATINEALSDGILRHDPKKGVKGFAQPDSVREFLTLEELKKLVHVECELPVLKQAFLFSCLTGLRYGDVEKLKWNDIQYSENLGY
ncbi:MAG: site-specific integrase, partial [Cyclobacteriaceae bacterium]|nr:site-specific integrase [Cyclobacteriaceae bacterium]